ncbi:MAG: DMT family transporter, partial [Deferrisomatales bacterium]|nr:DMT family transporter [Deferrisomatales bacterium]
LIGFVVVLAFHGTTGLKNLKTRRPLLHMLRSVVGISAMSCMFYSVTHMVLADATAIMFSRPLFMILIAFLLLGERISWRHAAAIVFGFFGILLIARPGASSFQPTTLVAASGALLGAFVVVIIKKLAATERTMVIMFYYTMWTTIISFIPAVFFWKTPTTRELVVLVVIGCIGVAGQGLITHGFGAGDATVTVPFDYLRLVYATLFGIFLFSEFPDILSIAGALFIVCSNLYILFLKRQHKVKTA